MSDKIPKSHRRSRPSLMWRVRDWFDRALARTGKGFGNLAETFEWAMHRGARLLMPWTWFQKQGEFQEYPRDHQPNVAESFEFYFHRFTGALGTLLMPWRWFRKNDRNEDAAEQITGERSGSLAETFEWIVGTFFEKCGDVFRVIGQILLPRQVVKSTGNVQQAITKSTLKTSYKLRKRFEAFAERYLPRQIFWPLYWIGRQGWHAFDFVSEWWWSREYRKLTWGVPAILMLMPLSASLVAGLWNTDSKKIQHYNTSLREAQQTESKDRTILLKRKLEQLGYQRLDMADFRAALELADKDRLDEAYEKLRTVAPLETPGLFDAHLWLAAQMMQGNIQPTPEDATALGTRDPWRVFAKHVEHALTLEPEHKLAKRYRAEILLHDKQWLAAIAQLEELVDEYPDFHATLAHTYNSLGDVDQARKSARRAIAHYDRIAARFDDDQVATQVSVKQTSLKPNVSQTEDFEAGNSDADPELIAPDQTREELVGSEPKPTAKKSPLSPLGYLRLAEAYNLVADYDHELDLLEQGIKKYPKDKKLREAFAGVRMRRLSELRYSDPRMQDLMESICREDRNNQMVVRALVRGLLAKEQPNEIAKIGLNVAAIGNEDRTKASEAAWKIHQHLRSEDLISAEVYLRLGNFYLVQSDHPKAIRFFQETCKLDPNIASAWNNLGWIWSHEPPVDLEKALEASNRAIQIKSDPRFIETRGQIYIKQKAWEKAAADLETAIAGAIAGALDAHRSLVLCYEALGQKEQAEAHRRIIEAATR